MGKRVGREGWGLLLTLATSSVLGDLTISGEKGKMQKHGWKVRPPMFFPSLTISMRIFIALLTGSTLPTQSLGRKLLDDLPLIQR